MASRLGAAPTATVCLMAGVGLNDSLWIAPTAIRFKISPVRDLSGDWDIERRHEFTATAKYRSIVQHFVEGRDWIDTDLFTDTYPRRLARDGRIGRATTLTELAQDYERRFDGMFEQMRREGFRLANDRGKPHALPTFLIGRDGEVMIGNQGNHRLAIAKVLGLDEIAGMVTCRKV